MVVQRRAVTTHTNRQHDINRIVHSSTHRKIDETLRYTRIGYLKVLSQKRNSHIPSPSIKKLALFLPTEVEVLLEGPKVQTPWIGIRSLGAPGITQYLICLFMFCFSCWKCWKFIKTAPHEWNLVQFLYFDKFYWIVDQVGYTICYWINKRGIKEM